MSCQSLPDLPNVRKTVKLDTIYMELVTLQNRLMIFVHIHDVHPVKDFFNTREIYFDSTNKKL